MYGSLRGTVLTCSNGRTLLEVNNVGYWVHTGSWQPEGDTFCYLYHQVREDADELFGFAGLEQLTLFERLIAISGIGPKAGLALTSLGTAAEIEQAILAQDVTYLSKAPGVGKKAAQKIILEIGQQLTTLPIQVSQLNRVSEKHDLALALEQLGYPSSQVAHIVTQLPAEHTTLEAQVRWALSNL